MKDLSLHIMDIVQNSVRAEARLIQVSIDENKAENSFRLVVEDNGKGMSAEVLARVSDAYYTSRSTRKVGLGIPLLKQAAEACEGFLRMDSYPGTGTRLEAVFQLDHLDRAPLGDMAGVMSMLAGGNPLIDFIYRHQCGDQEYCFDTREVKEALEGVPISELAVIRFMREMIAGNLEEIRKEIK